LERAIDEVFVVGLFLKEAVREIDGPGADELVVLEGQALRGDRRLIAAAAGLLRVGAVERL
jgi:hypothetical protein